MKRLNWRRHKLPHMVAGHKLERVLGPLRLRQEIRRDPVGTYHDHQPELPLRHEPPVRRLTRAEMSAAPSGMEAAAERWRNKNG